MTKDELVNSLQKRDPLLANAVSNMVEYISDRFPAAYPSKEQTEAVNTKNTQQPKIMTVPKPMPTADNTPKIRHFDFYTDEFHHYPVDIAQNCLDVIDENIALDADNVFAKIGDVQKTAILLFAEYIDAATTIAAQSGGGGGGATSSWGRDKDKDEDELSWAHRCAMMANRLCRPRKKQGYGR